MIFVHVKIVELESGAGYFTPKPKMADICEICYGYDLCMADGPNRNPDGPCKDKDCIHRPKLVGEWEAA